jgi:DNA transformation protein
MRETAEREGEARDEFVVHVLDLLRDRAPVTARRMFGGHGLFRGAVMFGLITRETLYFKTDDGNRGDYEAAGMTPFSYTRPGRPAVVMSYHAVPPELLEGDDDLALWAERAFAAALRTRQPKPARSSPRGGRKARRVAR